MAEGLTPVLRAVDGLSTSAEEKGALRSQVVTSFVDAQSKVLVAEAGGNWLTASWRPLLMLCFGGILVYSFFFGPMFNLKTVPIPAELWTLLQIGIGGYIGGRSLEKIVPMVVPFGKKDRIEPPTP